MTVGDWSLAGRLSNYRNSRTTAGIDLKRLCILFMKKSMKYVQNELQLKLHK